MRNDETKHSELLRSCSVFTISWPLLLQGENTTASGRGTEEGAILLHFCGSPDPVFMQQSEPCLWWSPSSFVMGARLRGRTATQRSKKGSEKVLGRVLGEGSQKGS